MRVLCHSDYHIRLLATLPRLLAIRRRSVITLFFSLPSFLPIS